MGQSSDETRIREMIRRLKRADEREVPPFEDVLGRSVCRPDGRSMRHRQLVFVFAVGAVLLIAVLFVRSRSGEDGGGVRPNIAEQHGPRQTLDGPQVRGIVDLDFDHMHAVVGRHFSDAEADLVFATPIWSTPTDSLLGLNFNLSQTQE